MNRIASVIFVSVVIGLGLSLLPGSRGIRAQAKEPMPPATSLVDVGSGFTYQGKLDQNNLPVDDNCDFEFRLFDTATGTPQIGNVDTQSNVPVINGLFTVTLNAGNQFGANAFDGQAKWLEIRVRCPTGSPGFTVLEPRQLLTAAPYTHNSLSLIPGAIISGTVPSPNRLLTLHNNANGTGLAITQAGNVGILVESTTNAGVRVVSVPGHGLQVQSAGFDGLNVGSAEDGVDIVAATDNGVEIDAAGGYGVSIDHAGGHGIFLCSNGSATDCVFDELPATLDGLRIGRTNGHGVFIGEAGSHNRAGWLSVPSGFVARSVEGVGLYIGGAGASGASMIADLDGVTVRGDADIDGIGDGINADTGSFLVADEWGVRTEDKLLAEGGVSTSALTLVAKVAEGQSLQAGDLATAVGLADPLREGSSPLPLVAKATVSTGNLMGVVQGRMAMVADPIPAGREADSQAAFTSLRSQPGTAVAGDYVAIIVLGTAQVKVDRDIAITAGQRLTVAETAGKARPLQTRLWDGMRVAEDAPTVGIALEDMTAVQNGLVWILINPQ